MIGFLDRRLPPINTVFSYFPADRAIPAQEQPVQIGPGDANNQLESHDSQLHFKYSRLKNTIFNAVVSQADAQAQQFSRSSQKFFVAELQLMLRSLIKRSFELKSATKIRADLFN